MRYHFIGKIAELKRTVINAGIRGKWSCQGDKYTFRTYEGGVLNWWPNGTVIFQGSDRGKMLLETFIAKHLTYKR